VDVGPGVRIAFTTAGRSATELAKRNIHKYLAKPFNLDDVLAFVAEALRSK
jgi:ActR/RegA family two-component response regulator